MVHTSKPIDYLNDSPVRILVGVAFPLLLVNAVQILASLLTNALYSNFVGQIAFSVTGYVNSFLSFFNSISSGISSASWIKAAPFLNENNKEGTQKKMVTPICTILFVTLLWSLLLLFMTRPILQLANIPDNLYANAKLYYILQCISNCPSALSSFLLTVLNGTRSSKNLFWINLFHVIANAVVAVIVLAGFRAGFLGVAILPLLNGLITLIFYLFLLQRSRHISLRIFFRNFYKPDWTMLKDTICYGSLIISQTLLCSTSYLIVSVQANRYLTSDFISVLSVNLPLAGVFSALSSAVTVFCPRNYAAGNKSRLKQFFTLTTVIGVLYGVLCFLIYALLGQWYYGRLFDNPDIIAYGTRYWFWTGLSYPFLALIYTVRFFMDSVGRGKFSLLSGGGEFTGNLICALWLIPQFGNIGRILSYPLGWFLGGVALLIAYFFVQKKIYAKKAEE